MLVYQSIKNKKGPGSKTWKKTSIGPYGGSCPFLNCLGGLLSLIGITKLLKKVYYDGPIIALLLSRIEKQSFLEQRWTGAGLIRTTLTFCQL